MPSSLCNGLRQLLAAGSAVIFLLNARAVGAPVELPGAVQPGHDREVPTPSAPKFDFRIESPHRAPPPRAVDKIRFILNDIRVCLASPDAADCPDILFAKNPDTDADFHRFLNGRIAAKKGSGEEVSLADVYGIASDIESYYREHNYILVHAYIPPQHVAGGHFTIRVVEGYVDNVIVEGASPRTKKRIESYFNPVRADRPLRGTTIERALLLTTAVPGVHATGVLRASPDVQGASDLYVTVSQPMVDGDVAANNRGSHFTGIWNVTGHAGYNDIFGSDRLDATISVAPHQLEQQLSGRVDYGIAVGDQGGLASLIVSGQKGAPGGTLGTSHIRTDSWAAGPRFSYPFERTRNESFSVDGGFTFQDATVDILGVSISHDVWRVVDLAFLYEYHDGIDGVLDSSFGAAKGLAILGATSPTSPNLSLGGRTDFTKLTASYEYKNSFAAPLSIDLRANGQYAFSPLIEGEQILFGGTMVGRGYDPGAITGDSGYGVSAELRYDIPRPVKIIALLEPYAYYEDAAVWNRQRPLSVGITLPNQAINSVGAGVRLWFPYQTYLDLECSRTLNAVEGSDGDKRATKFFIDIAKAF
jgi:hemolysin activation/secretion protein